MTDKKKLTGPIYAGALGHTWAVTYVDANGVERMRGECHDGRTAAHWADEEKSGEPHIWTRHRKGWKEVPYRAAVLDGPAD